MKRFSIPSVILFASVFMITGASLFSAGNRESTDQKAAAPLEPVSIRIGALKGPTGMSMLQLFQDMPSLGESVDAVYEIVNSPDLMTARILSGEISIASLPTNLAAKMYNKGTPIRLAAVTGDAAFYILSLRNDVTSVADLRGKTLYSIGKGANPELVLNEILSAAGLDPLADLTVDYRYSQLEAAALLAAGKIDLAFLPEPFASTVRAKNPSVAVVIDIQREWRAAYGPEASLPVSVVVVSEALIAKRPDVVRAFLRSYREAIVWINQHPQEGGALAETYMEFAAPVASKAIPNLNLRFSLAVEARGEIERYLSLLLKADPYSVGGKLPDEAFYYSE